MCVCCSMVAPSAWPYLIVAVTMAAKAHVIREKEGKKGGVRRSRRCADEGEPPQPHRRTTSRAQSPIYTPPHTHTLFTSYTHSSHLLFASLLLYTHISDQSPNTPGREGHRWSHLEVCIYGTVCRNRQNIKGDILNVPFGALPAFSALYFYSLLVSKAADASGPSEPGFNGLESHDQQGADTGWDLRLRSKIRCEAVETVFINVASQRGSLRWLLKWNSDTRPLVNRVRLHVSGLLHCMEPTECAALQRVFVLLISWPLKQLNLTHITYSVLERL